MIRVCVVDDQTLVRQGVLSLLGLADDVTVVAEAADGDEALDVLAREDLDVVLLDLRMPGRDGIATLEAMRERGIDIPVLVLTTFDDDELVLKALRAAPAATCSRTSRSSSSCTPSAPWPAADHSSSPR
ncbi:response regulator transcription factor [Saccharomonospora sp. CUA-673]|uniref:response regulator n=1 Tax=Saccharomonospora sp. CUA-673 TaxID=1904969 RepID=UPI000A80BAD9|nr:response regulator transcription factor [Saccharomonospora sp. CUA-673]